MTVRTLGHARPVVDLDTLTRPDWLDARRNGIGGSDAAAVCGLDPYRSAFELFLDKTRILPDDDRAGEAADWGRLLEPVIADEVARRHSLDVQPVGWMLAHPDHDWMLADLDRAIIDHGEPGILEIKSTSPFRSDAWRDGPPIAVMCQVQHYLAVTGLRWVLVAVLIGGQRLVIHRVERDDALIGSLIDIETRFWKAVQDRQPPAPDGSQATTDLLAHLYDVNPDSVAVVEVAEVEQHLAALAQARARQDAAETDRRQAENELKVMMASAALLTDLDGNPVARWPEVHSRRIDVERLRADHPDIAEEYTKTTTSRRFTIVGR